MKPTNGDGSYFKTVSNKYVLDLGCGAGILGILALKAGAYVHFSDYVNIWQPLLVSKINF